MEVAHHEDMNEQMQIMTDESIQFWTHLGDSQEGTIQLKREAEPQKINYLREDNTAVALFCSNIIEASTEL